ncbi:hypothetical protein JOS77_28460 [Chromobacterium haemolyticum]|nr:hypothetical protein JOS77_28460 [Chromobacterium haemolyticum]
MLLTLAVALLGLFVVGGFGLLQLHRANERFDYLQINPFPASKLWIRPCKRKPICGC